MANCSLHLIDTELTRLETLVRKMWIEILALIILLPVLLFLSIWKIQQFRNFTLKSPNGVKVMGLLLSTIVTPLTLIVRYIPNYEVAHVLSQLWGNILVIRHPLLTTTYAAISDLKIAKQVMSSAGWINRIPSNYYLTDATFKKPIGLLFSNGEDWKELRKLTMKILHQLDFFKHRHLEKFITSEIVHVEDDLRRRIEQSGGEEVTICLHQMFELATLNIVYQVIMNKRFDHGDPVAEAILRTMNVANRDFSMGVGPTDLFPWLRHIPGLTFLDSWKKASNTCYDYFRTEVLEKRRTNGSFHTEPTDFADFFLQEIDKSIRGQCPGHITDEAFLVCMRDLVFGGSDTTNSTMEHGILHVALQPDIQKKVQREIDQVLGQFRTPSYDDRLRMPYTQATLWEILRIASPVPLTTRSPLAHSTICDIQAPKGSLWAVNIYSIHRSNEIWDDPSTFRPKRFLNAEGDQVVNTEKIIPFGHGRRMCIGETVARTTLFIFFVSLMQKFTFELSKNHPPPSMRNVIGLSRCPVPYYVTVRPRETEGNVVNNNAENLKPLQNTLSTALVLNKQDIAAEGSKLL